jgi:hypothetical protein
LFFGALNNNPNKLRWKPGKELDACGIIIIIIIILIMYTRVC